MLTLCNVFACHCSVGAGGPLSFEQGSRIVEVDLSQEDELKVTTYATTFKEDRERQFELKSVAQTKTSWW